MEIRIGIKHAPRELAFDTDTSADEVRGLVESAIAEDKALLALSDTKGRQYFIDTDSIAYIEVGGDGSRRVGFVS